MQTRPENRLEFSEGCRLMYDDSGNNAAINFNGDCYGQMPNDSKPAWDISASASFTVVWIGRFNSEAEQSILYTSRSPSDTTKELIWTNNRVIAYDVSSEFPTGMFGIDHSMSPPASGQWTMEVISREQGGTRASYTRYGTTNRPEVSSFPSTPTPLAMDLFTVGFDFRDKNRYLDGDIAVLLVYTRALSTSDILQLAEFYKPRFGLNVPPGRLMRITVVFLLT